MLCKTTKEEATVLNTLASQIQTLMTGSVQGASLIVAGSAPASPCIRSSAPVQALMNHLLMALLGHRQAHGEFTDINALSELRGRPDVLEALVGDANDLFAASLRGLDPAHDYLLNLFKTEKAREPK